MKYSIKVWLFTVFTSPMLLTLFLFNIFSAKWNEIAESWPIPLFMLAYGLVFSFPSMVVFWLLQRKLTTTFTAAKTKLILSSYAFVSVWVTFYIFDREFIESGFQQAMWAGFIH